LSCGRIGLVCLGFSVFFQVFRVSVVGLGVTWVFHIFSPYIISKH